MKVRESNCILERMSVLIGLFRPKLLIQDAFRNGHIMFGVCLVAIGGE